MKQLAMVYVKKNRQTLALTYVQGRMATDECVYCKRRSIKHARTGSWRRPIDWYLPDHTKPIGKLVRAGARPEAIAIIMEKCNAICRSCNRIYFGK